MSLGERIARLRGSKNLSQGELADLLGVSRQSVSKWETDGSVPELEKLTRLSELFEVSLDELVKGETPPPAAPAEAPPAKRRWEGRKIAGTILFCMGFLVVLLCALIGGLLEGLILASPFLLCGAVCFLTKKHPGLWCGWVMYLLATIYLLYATGIRWSLILWTFRYEPEMNYMRLAIAWVQVLWMILMVVLTARRLGREPLAFTGRSRALLLAGWAVLIGSQFAIRLLWPMLDQIFLVWIIDALRLIFFTALTTVTLRCWRGRSGKRADT